MSGTLTLRELNLGENHFGDSGGEFIAAGILHNYSVTMLDLGWNEFGVQTAKVLGEALKGNATLLNLILRTHTLLYSIERNKLGSEGASALADSLLGNYVLSSLDLCKMFFFMQ